MKSWFLLSLSINLFWPFHYAHANCGRAESMAYFQDKLWYIDSGKLFYVDRDGIATHDTGFRKGQGMTPMGEFALYGFKDLWVVARRHSVLRFDGSTWVEYKPSPVEYDSWLFEDSEGRVWLLSNGRGMAMFTGNSWTHFNKATGFPSDNLGGIASDSNGGVWVGTQENGACNFGATPI